MTPVELGEHRTRARSRRRRALLCLPVVVGLAVAAVLTTHDGIADDLRARTGATLHAAGYERVQVEFSGREASVRGAVARPVDRYAVEAIIEGQRGVRWADMQQVRIDAMPAAPASAATPASEGE